MARNMTQMITYVSDFSGEVLREDEVVSLSLSKRIPGTRGRPKSTVSLDISESESSDVMNFLRNKGATRI